MADTSTGFLSNKTALLGAALLMVLTALFLINWGVRGVVWLYWLGVALLFLGLLLAPLSRFTADKQAQDKAGTEEEHESNSGKRQGK